MSFAKELRGDGEESQTIALSDNRKAQSQANEANEASEANDANDANDANMEQHNSTKIVDESRHSPLHVQPAVVRVYA